MDNKRQSRRWEKRFEVSLRRFGDQHYGVMTNISNVGMEVRTRERFQMNDEIRIQIKTPDGESFHYLGVVRWWRPVHGRKMGIGLFRFGLKHLAVDPEHARLMELVEYDPTRRGDEARVDVEVPAVVEMGNPAKETFTANISTHGAFLKLDELPPPYPKEKLSISISLPDEKPPIHATGTVVHMLQPGQAQRLDLDSGFGFAFSEVNEGEMDRLKAFLKRIREEHQKEASSPVEEENDLQE